ncbi:hypothetical protein [Evansella cellulosilytica]|uniref:hypothetical protein n=1 Tax=Evansella cellulosilytica TaxID=1413 RepID=UPI0012F66F3F|nr:hypothetical protein [Evansella cellulosilytica]
MTAKDNEKNQEGNVEATLELIRIIHRNLGIITAILLLTGQITIMGVFVTPRGFRVTMAGPITGSRRIESKTGNPLVNLTIDVIDILIAKQLLQDKFFITGSALTPFGFTINAGGPLLGVERMVPKVPSLFHDLDNFNMLVAKLLNFDPSIANKYQRK